MTTEQQLPEGWKKTTLGEISIVKMGQSPNGKSYNKEKEGYLLIGGASDLGDIYPSPKQYTNEATKLSKANDIIICIRATIGRLNLSDKVYCLGRGVAGIEVNANVEAKFIWYSLMNSETYLLKNSTGTTFQQVSSPTLKKLPIVYPTSKETQQAIVNKIESLFDEIDEGIGRLKTAAQQIQQYRQSLLKNAFNGELTKEWRSKHADTLPSANELLAQIQTTREQHHAQQLADWQAAVSQWEQNGKEGKKPSKPKAPTQAVKFEENSENRNKNSYIRIPIGFFIETPKYGTSKKCEYEKYENSTGVIRIPNITENGLINLEDMKYAEFSTEDKTDYALKKGDLLLIRSNGSVNIVGSVGLVGLEETNYIYAGYLIRLRPIQGIVNSRFLKFAFQSLDVRTQIEFKAKSTSGVNNINAQEVQDLQVNVFSLPEQTQIVAILESKLTACDQLAAELANQLKQAELLKQAVLKAAFSGSLLDK